MQKLFLLAALLCCVQSTPPSFAVSSFINTNGKDVSISNTNSLGNQIVYGKTQSKTQSKAVPILINTLLPPLLSSDNQLDETTSVPSTTKSPVTIRVAEAEPQKTTPKVVSTKSPETTRVVSTKSPTTIKVLTTRTTAKAAVPVLINTLLPPLLSNDNQYQLAQTTSAPSRLPPASIATRNSPATTRVTTNNSHTTPRVGSTATTTARPQSSSTLKPSVKGKYRNDGFYVVDKSGAWKPDNRGKYKAKRW